MRGPDQRTGTVDGFPSAAVRPRGLRGLERRLARAFWSAQGPLERAEVVVTLVRALAVLTAMQAHTRRSVADAEAEQAELERVLVAAMAHLQATRQRQSEPAVEA